MGFFNGRPLEADAIFISRFCVQLVMILALPRLLHAAILSHLLQPRVVSEIVSGIILGPSCLGQIDGFTDLFFPSGSLVYLSALGQLGVILFMFMTGCHLDIEKILKNKWQALATSFVGTGLTFCIAPAMMDILQNSDYTNFDATQTILLTAIILSISAEAVLARILAERQLLTSNLGSVCMATSTIDVLVCFVLLGALVSIYESQHIWQPPTHVCPGQIVYHPDADSLMDPLWIFLVFIGYILAVVTIGRFMFGKLAERVAQRGRMEAVVFVASMILLFTSAWITQTLTVSSLLGGLVLGLFGVPRIGPFCTNLEHALGPITVSIFLPVFFALVGLSTNWRLLTADDVGVAFALLGCLIATRFFGGIAISYIFDGRGFKNLYYGALMSCKGLTVLTIFNILLSTESITHRFYALAVLYALISVVMVSPFIAFVQVFEHRRKKERAPRDTPISNTKHLLVVIRTAYLAPICAVTASMIVECLPLDVPTQTVFLRFIEDLDEIEAFLPLIQFPIEEQVLAGDPILGSAYMSWKGLHPRGDVIYKAIPTPDIQSTYQRMCDGIKETNDEPFQYVFLDFDGTDDSLRMINEALHRQHVTLVIATCQPSSLLTGAQSALFCHPADSISEYRPCLERFMLADSGKHIAYHWWEKNAEGRPPEVQECASISEVLHVVNHLRVKPCFNVIFLPIPLHFKRLTKWLRLAYRCHIPVIFEGSLDQDPVMSETGNETLSTVSGSPLIQMIPSPIPPTRIEIDEDDGEV